MRRSISLLVGWAPFGRHRRRAAGASFLAAPLSLRLTLVGAAAVAAVAAVVLFSIGPRPVPPPGPSSLPFCIRAVLRNTALAVPADD